MYKGNHYRAVCERVTHELNVTRAVAILVNTAQKMKFSFKDFFSKCNQIRTEEILMENFIFCAVRFRQLMGNEIARVKPNNSGAVKLNRTFTLFN